MAALADIDDFEARHGIQPSDEEAKITTLLEDASAFIRGELAGATAEWAVDDAPEDVTVPAVVAAVCVQVAYRAWSNPNGVAREQLGEAAVTYRGDDQSDAMWITKNEARMIRKAAGGSTVRSVGVETPYSGPAIGESDYDLHAGHGEGL